MATAPSALRRRDDAAADAAIGAGGAGRCAVALMAGHRLRRRRAGEAARVQQDAAGLDLQRDTSRTLPSSAPCASPVSRSMTQLCSGQVTTRPCTMPWLSGPPLCGQLSSQREHVAIGGPEDRDVALGRAHDARAAQRDVVHARRRRSSRACACSFRGLRQIEFAQSARIRGLPCRRRARPRDRSARTSARRRSARSSARRFAVVHRSAGATESMPTRFDPFVDALEIAALLAIELRQRRDHLDRLVLGRDLAQEVGAA